MREGEARSERRKLLLSLAVGLVLAGVLAAAAAVRDWYVERRRDAVRAEVAALELRHLAAELRAHEAAVVMVENDLSTRVRYRVAWLEAAPAGGAPAVRERVTGWLALPTQPYEEWGRRTGMAVYAHRRGGAERLETAWWEAPSLLPPLLHLVGEPATGAWVRGPDGRRAWEFRAEWAPYARALDRLALLAPAGEAVRVDSALFAAYRDGRPPQRYGKSVYAAAYDEQSGRAEGARLARLNEYASARRSLRDPQPDPAPALPAADPAPTALAAAPPPPPPAAAVDPVEVAQAVEVVEDDEGDGVSSAAGWAVTRFVGGLLTRRKAGRGVSRAPARVVTTPSRPSPGVSARPAAASAFDARVQQRMNPPAAQPHVQRAQAREQASAARFDARVQQRMNPPAAAPPRTTRPVAAPARGSRRN